MNYHIIFNNSYCLGFIDDICSLNQEENNVFWFRGEEEEKPAVADNISFSFLGAGHNKFEEKLAKLEDSDNIIVHYYDLSIARFLMKLPNTIIAFHWGGDFFQDPYWYHIHWVFDKKTKKYVIENERQKVTWRKNLFKMYQQRKEILNLPKELYKEKNEQMGRIDYVLCNEFNKADLVKTKSLYPKFRAEHLPASYNLRFDEVLSLVDSNMVEQDSKPRSKLKLLLGNSATPANNHLDSFDALKTLKDVEIYCVLAYGDDKYAKTVIEAGRKIFKENFIPILDMKKPNEYIRFLNDMDLIFMYHNRSQAWGNISQCIAMGKPIFLKNENSLKDYIECMGITIYDVDKISSYDHFQIMEDEMSKMKDNREIIRNTFSDVARLNCLDKILKEYAV